MIQYAGKGFNDFNLDLNLLSNNLNYDETMKTIGLITKSISQIKNIVKIKKDLEKKGWEERILFQRIGRKD